MSPPRRSRSLRNCAHERVSAIPPANCVGSRLLGGLVLVDPRLDLVDVAFAVAQDDAERVEQWMEARQLLKPSASQIEAWQEDDEERFTVVIVQPYVLAQRDTGSLTS